MWDYRAESWLVRVETERAVAIYFKVTPSILSSSKRIFSLSRSFYFCSLSLEFDLTSTWGCAAFPLCFYISLRRFTNDVNALSLILACESSLNSRELSMSSRFESLNLNYLRERVDGAGEYERECCRVVEKGRSVWVEIGLDYRGSDSYSSLPIIYPTFFSWLSAKFSSFHLARLRSSASCPTVLPLRIIISSTSLFFSSQSC